MKILVTGASGFIGRNLLLRLKDYDAYVYAVYNSDREFPSFMSSIKHRGNIDYFKCDLVNEKLSDYLMADHFDVCVHLAANSDPTISTENSILDLNCNVNTVLNIIDSGLTFDKFILFSSGAVYDGLVGQVDYLSEVNPTLAYGISKLTAERYVKSFQKRGSISNYIILRFFGAFGPYESNRKIFTRMFKDIIINNHKTFEIRGDGTNLIDAMYIDDAIQGIMNVIENKEVKNSIYDFNAANPITIENLVHIFCETFDKEVEVVKKGSTAEPITFFVNSKRFAEDFDFKIKFTVQDGLKKFYKFFSEGV